MKALCVFCCTTLIAFSAYGRSIDTFKVYFALNDSKINRQIKDYIDHLVFKDLLIHGQKLIVLGYADYVGDNVYNDKLSATRAKNVQDYLITTGFDLNDIKICIGKGKINRTNISGKDGYEPDRKVEIIIDHAAQEGSKESRIAAAKKKDSTLIRTSAIKVNAVYPLNILFENGSSFVLPKSTVQLQLLYNFMVKNPTVRIQVEGHICCLGGPGSKGDGEDANGGGPLSWNRAKFIYKYLLDHGIKAERVQYKGFGGSRPLINPEVTEEDKEKNRRVEIRILSD